MTRARPCPVWKCEGVESVHRRHLASLSRWARLYAVIGDVWGSVVVALPRVHPVSSEGVTTVRPRGYERGGGVWMEWVRAAGQAELFALRSRPVPDFATPRLQGVRQHSRGVHRAVYDSHVYDTRLRYRLRLGRVRAIGWDDVGLCRRACASQQTLHSTTCLDLLSATACGARCVRRRACRSHYGAWDGVDMGAKQYGPMWPPPRSRQPDRIGAEGVWQGRFSLRNCRPVHGVCTHRRALL